MNRTIQLPKRTEIISPTNAIRISKNQNFLSVIEADPLSNNSGSPPNAFINQLSKRMEIYYTSASALSCKKEE